MINVDTNVLIAAIGGSLRRDEARLLDGDAWAISDIVIWELGNLERAGRIAPTLAAPEFTALLRRITVYEIDVRVGQALRLLDFRSDPADETIAATSIVHEIPLLTRDARILSSKVVPLALS